MRGIGPFDICRSSGVPGSHVPVESFFPLPDSRLFMYVGFEMTKVHHLPIVHMELFPKQGCGEVWPWIEPNFPRIAAAAPGTSVDRPSVLL